MRQPFMPGPGSWATWFPFGQESLNQARTPFKRRLRKASLPPKPSNCNRSVPFKRSVISVSRCCSSPSRWARKASGGGGLGDLPRNKPALVKKSHSERKNSPMKTSKCRGAMRIPLGVIRFASHKKSERESCFARSLLNRESTLEASHSAFCRV